MNPLTHKDIAYCLLDYNFVVTKQNDKFIDLINAIAKEKIEKVEGIKYLPLKNAIEQLILLESSNPVRNTIKVYELNGIRGLLSLKKFQDYFLLTILKLHPNNLADNYIDEMQQDLGNYFEVLNHSAIIAITDPNGIITYVNQKFCELSKYSSKELIGKTHQIINSGYHPKGFFKSLWKVILKGEVWKGLIKNKAKDGSFYWVDSTIVPFKNLEEKITHFVAIRFDVTERVHYEESILKLTSEQEAIIENTDYLIITTDTNGLITSYNKGAERMLGYTREEMVGIKTPEIIHVMDEVMKRSAELNRSEEYKHVPGFETFVIKSRVTKTFDENKWTYIAKNGNKIPVNLSVSTIFNKVGEPTGYMGVAKDITKELKEYERLKVLFEYSSSTHLILNEGVVVECNPATLVLFNLDNVDQIINKKLVEFLPEMVNGQSAQVLCNQFQSENRATDFCKFDFEFKKISGEVFPAEMSITKIKVGSIKMDLVVLNDLTERNKARNELEKAKEQALRAVRAKDTFLANISHEIRTPMNAILGFADILNNMDVTEEQKEYIEIIDHAGKNLLVIINDILDTSKMEAGHLVIDQSPFSIYETVADVKKLLSFKAKEKGLILKFFSDSEIPPIVIGDSVRLTQILINIINNAIKFTSKGSVSVYADLLQKSKKESRVRFTVIDTGIGIDKKNINHIFEPFQQEHSFTSKKYGGTGLGLTISKKLVELHGGNMAVESEVGKGATFVIEVPYKNYNVKRNGRNEVVGKFKSPKIADNTLVFVAEDVLVNQKLISKILVKFGVEFRVFSNGQELLEELTHTVPDIILMDLEMPIMNGVDATLAIRNEMKLNLPIIALTAHSLVGEMDRCLAVGMNDYLPKPFNSETLRMKIIENLKFDQSKLRKQKVFIDTTEKLILIAEDIPLNQKLIDKVLRNVGFDTRIYENGKLLCDALKSGVSGDLILMDLQMPVMDGIQATKYIRNKIKSKIPIVALTAHSLTGEKEKCLEAGMDDYVTKPFDQKKLIALIQSYLGRLKRTSLASTTEKPTKLLNFNLLDDVAEGDMEFKNQMIELYISNIPYSVNQMLEKHKDRNFVEIKQIAHKLKSTYNLFGLSRAEDICDIIENKEKDVKKIKELLVELTALTSESLTEIK